MPLNHTHQSLNGETLSTQPHTLARTWSRGKKPEFLAWMPTSLRSPLQVTSSAYRQETVRRPSHRISDARTCTGRNEPDANNCCWRRTELSVRSGSLLGSPRRSPLTCLSPAQTLCLPRPTAPSPVQAAELPSALLHCLRSSPPAPPPPSSCFKIMVAVCFTCLTDSSGSGWLDPHGLCQGSLPSPRSSLPCRPTWWQPTPPPGSHALRCAVSSAQFVTFSPLITFVPHFVFYLKLTKFVQQIWAIEAFFLLLVLLLPLLDSKREEPELRMSLRLHEQNHLFLPPVLALNYGQHHWFLFMLPHFT